MKVSSKEHKETRRERVAKAIYEAWRNEIDPPADEPWEEAEGFQALWLQRADKAIDAYPDPPSEKEKDNRTIIPKPNDSIVLCMLRSEAVALATALDTLPDEYKRTKALATALREQKVV